MKSLATALFLIVLLGASEISAAAEFQVARSSIDGVELRAVATPEGQSAVRQALTAASSQAIIQPALPYSLLVRNTGTRTILLYVVRFDFIDDSGRPVASTAIRDYRTSSPKLTPGTYHIVTPVGGFTQAIATGQVSGFGASAAYARSLNQLNRMDRASRIVASVDSAVYDDYHFVGPDASGIFVLLAEEANTLRSILRSLQQQQSSTDREIITMLDGRMRDLRLRPPTTTMLRLVNRLSVLRLMVEKGDRGQYMRTVDAILNSPSVVSLWR